VIGWQQPPVQTICLQKQDFERARHSFADRQKFMFEGN